LEGSCGKDPRGADHLRLFFHANSRTPTHRPSSITSVASDTSLVVAASQLLPSLTSHHTLFTIYQVTLTCCSVAGWTANKDCPVDRQDTPSCTARSRSSAPVPQILLV
ncbi:hypothetical protein KCU87_g179, partial [Aureobasidium melanogenum]